MCSTCVEVTPKPSTCVVDSAAGVKQPGGHHEVTRHAQSSLRAIGALDSAVFVSTIIEEALSRRNIQ